MSFPNIFPINPEISLSKDEAINLMLTSIAFEELAQAHILNAEGEKLQYVFGTLKDASMLETPPTFAQIIEINKSVERVLRNIIKHQMLLQFKLEDLLELSNNNNIFANTAIVTATYNGINVSASDRAYYHTKGGEK